jgi:hypothetical protein
MNAFIEGVSKALAVRFTPKSPRGDFLIFSIFKYPPWGQGVKKELLRHPYLT